MQTNLPHNPYNADYGDDVSNAPFAGRQNAFAKMYQHLSRQDRGRGLLFLGRRHIGKTSLLRAFDRIFSDTHLPAYVALKETSFDSELEFFLALAGSATEALIDRGYTISRIVDIRQPEGDDVREWFTREFVPPLLGAIRHSRRLVFLLDDIEQLIEATQSNALNSDLFAYLADLIKNHPQLDIVVSLDSEHESDINALYPLITTADVNRLDNLTLEQATWLLTAPTVAYYSVDDQAAAATMNATGGTPGLLQQFGYLMFRKWSNDNTHATMTAADVKAMIPTVYTYSERDYRDLWRALGAEERLALTAISALIYNDPVGRIDASLIETWLIDTDYPLDLIAINSALRGLEYREAVQITPQGIKLTAELLQMWLLEHARVGERRASAAPQPSKRKDKFSQRVNATTKATRSTNETPKIRYQSGTVRFILLFALVLLVSTAILFFSLASAPRESTDDNPQPTVTLISNP